MDKKVSLYLDLLRTMAALTVACYHLSGFAGGAFPFLAPFGHLAVIVFFVLSGYVIAYVADAQERDFEKFAARRLGRLYSVVVPALTLSFVLDRIGVHIAPDVYAGNTAFDHTLLRLFIHSLFLQEIWLVSVRFSSNGPLWSLGYEAFYYALFAFGVLYKGPFRRTLFTACALLAGPVIGLYGLIWLMGNAAYKIHKNARPALPTGAAWAVFLLTWAVFCAWPEWKPLVSTGIVLHRKFEVDTVLTDFIIAVLVFLNITAVRYISLALGAIERPVKFVAGMSFALYAFHYPLMLFFGALNERYAGLEGREEFGVILLLILVGVWGLSFVSEKQKTLYTKFFMQAAERVKSLISGKGALRRG